MARKPKIEIVYEGWTKLVLFKTKDNPKIQGTICFEIEDAEEFKPSYKKKQKRMEKEER